MTCRRCGNPIERTPLGGWGTRVPMTTGCYHVPVSPSASVTVGANSTARRQPPRRRAGPTSTDAREPVKKETTVVSRASAVAGQSARSATG